MMECLNGLYTQNASTFQDAQCSFYEHFLVVKNQGSSLLSLWSVHQQKKLTTQQRNGRVRFCQWFLISGNSCQRSQQKREKLYSHIVSIAERTTIDPAAGRWRIDQIHAERLTKSNSEAQSTNKFWRVTLLSKRFWEQTLFELAR